MSPEEMQVQKMMAAALRGQQIQAAQQERDADVYSALGGSLSGFGDKAIDSLANNASQRGNALAQLAARSRGQAFDSGQDMGKFQLTSALQARREAMARKEHLADVAQQQAWQEKRDKLNDENNLAQARILAGQKAEERKSDLKDKQIELLSRRTEGASGIKGDLTTLIKYAKEDDVPGVGLTGRLPSLLLSEDGVKARQSMRGIVGNLIKQRSGTAASEKEIDRILEELGMGAGASDEQFRLGVSRLAAQSADALHGVEAGAQPEAVEEARARGLVTSKDIPQYSPGEKGPASVPVGMKVQINKKTGERRLVPIGG